MANPLQGAVKIVKDKVKNTAKKVLNIKSDTLYNYDDKESREETVAYLTLYADGQRQPQVNTWRMCDNYYNNQHDASNELYDYCHKKNIPWIPAIVPDPYIHVESQINPDLPDFEFIGRDDDMDGQKAKTRQYVTQYVLDANEMLMKNNRNERRLGKFGNCIWKVGYDYNLEQPHNVHGDIFVHDVDPSNFINDPIAVDLDDGEYHIYPYKLHRIKAARIFAKELAKLGMTIEDIGYGRLINDEIYTTETYDTNFDTVQVVEFWFRQPKDGHEKYTWNVDGKEYTQEVEWEAGDIACTIQINTTEIKYIPLYWMKTHKQNKMFPFAIGYKVPVENKFWGKSEIEVIKELVDAADREFAITILNDTFTANDIIIMGQNAMAEGSEAVNEPAAIWKIREGTTIPPSRLGGLSNLNGGLKDTVNFIRDIIKQTIGNFEVNMGDTPAGNIRTLGALVQLKETGNARLNKKKVGTTAMWERVLKLIDYTAIEFYDDNRLIFLGATADQPEQIQQPWKQQAQEGQQAGKPIIFKYNSDNMRVYDDATNQYYYPVVDYRINVGDGITNSPAMTIDATEQLAKMPVTLANKDIVKSLTDLMKLPNKTMIKDSIDKYFESQATMPFVYKDSPKITIAFNDLAPDAQVQLLSQLGIQTQGGLNNELQTDLKKTEISTQAKQTPTVGDLLNGLDANELAHLKDNPQLLAEFVQKNGIQAGGQA